MLQLPLRDMATKKQNKLQAQHIIHILDTLFLQLPHLPEHIHELLIKTVPWFALIFGVLGIVYGILVLILTPLALVGGIRTSMIVFFTGLLTIFSCAFLITAYKPLVRQHYKGWLLLFLFECVNAVRAILTLHVLSVIGIILGLYLLFEIKRYYQFTEA